MDISQINSLFILFSGDSDIEKNSPLITSAINQVTKQLKDSSFASDIRLDYLCAAIANYRYTQINCVRNKVYYGPVGTAGNSGDLQLEYNFSRELMTEYYKTSADLLVDEDFIFSGVYEGWEE